MLSSRLSEPSWNKTSKIDSQQIDLSNEKTSAFTKPTNKGLVTSIAFNKNAKSIFEPLPDSLSASFCQASTRIAEQGVVTKVEDEGRFRSQMAVRFKKHQSRDMTPVPLSTYKEVRRHMNQSQDVKMVKDLNLF